MRPYNFLFPRLRYRQHGLIIFGEEPEFSKSPGIRVAMACATNRKTPVSGVNAHITESVFAAPDPRLGLLFPSGFPGG